MRKRSIYLFFLGSLLSFYSFTQSDTVRVTQQQIIVLADSVIIPSSDTTVIVPLGTNYKIFKNRYLVSKYFYDSMYASAQRSKITKELYNLLITNKPPEKNESTQDPKKSETYFEAYRGKTISGIKFASVDIFSGSVNDTTITSDSKIIQLCNKMHNNTRNAVVKKHLLFSIGDEVEPFEIADSERIIRSLSYMEDARIVLKIDPANIDHVQAIVITKDRFPWSGDLTVDSNGAAIFGFTNKNIIGTGNEFGLGYWHSIQDTPTHGYDAQYSIRNIRNSFVDGTIFTSNNYQGKSKGITFRRRFISPKIKYYGEATLEHVQPIQDLVFADSIYTVNSTIDRKSYDVWAARSFQIGARSNISFALRLDHDYFSKRPFVKLDSNIHYHNHHLLVGALSYSRINYLKTKRIQSFNITEDMPIGFIYSVLFGKDWTEFGIRNYRGIRASYSSYSNRIGYSLLNLESGYFLLSDKKTNQVFQIDLRHFTPLFSSGQTSSRIFTRISFFDGEKLSIPLSQSLSGENRLRNINGNQIRGNRLFTISSEYVVFQPWYFYGFRFATLVNAGMGHVRESRGDTPYKQTFFNVGAGIRIQNESLVFNTFEFRVSVFPQPPPTGQTLNLSLTLSTPNFFKSLTIGKPAVVGLD